MHHNREKFALQIIDPFGASVADWFQLRRTIDRTLILLLSAASLLAMQAALALVALVIFSGSAQAQSTTAGSSVNAPEPIRVVGSWQTKQLMEYLVTEAERQARGASRDARCKAIDEAAAMAERLAGETADEAYRRALSHTVSVISGGAGTGKTFVVARLATAFRDAGLSVALCAPTGKAAKRIEEVMRGYGIHIEARTIHRLLDYDGRAFRRESLSVADASGEGFDVIIADEMSMVDVPLLAELLRRIDFTRTRLVLVGDHNQLPPVGPGNVLRDIIQHNLAQTTVLTDVVRQAGILKANSTKVLSGVVAPTAAGDHAWTVVDSFREATHLQVYLRDLVLKHIPQRLGYDPLRQVQIITPMHNGPLGTKALNEMMQRLLHGRFDGRFAVGDKIIQTSNDYDLGVMNGTIGYVVGIEGKDTLVEFEGLPVMTLSREQISQVQLAYALTAHKAQGSECAVGGGNADSTDPGTWTTFDIALAAYDDNPALAGIGFVFVPDDGLCGVDLDDSIDLSTGQLKPWAREIVDRLDSYTEISPSGGGVKIFLRARKPGERCRRKHHDGEVEMYDGGRFFTVTGARLDIASGDIESRERELQDIYSLVFGQPESVPAPRQAQEPQEADSTAPTLSDDDIIRKACAGRKNGAKFTALWNGNWNDYFNSASEADSSVVFTLAFFTKDADRIDRLFRRSQLYRPKWDELHGTETYGRTTIAKALERVTGQYRPRKRQPLKSAGASGHGDQPPETGDKSIIPLGQRDPTTGKLVLSAKRTMPTAEAYFREFHSHADGRTLQNYAGLLMAWQDNRYGEVEDEAIKNRLQPWLHDALQYVVNRRTHEPELVPFDSNPGTIRSALESIRTFAHLPASLTPPAWIEGDADMPDATEILTCRTLNLHIPTGQTLPATPALFATNALEFDYDSEAPVPSA